MRNNLKLIHYFLKVLIKQKLKTINPIYFKIHFHQFKYAILKLEYLIH